MLSQTRTRADANKKNTVRSYINADAISLNSSKNTHSAVDTFIVSCLNNKTGSTAQTSEGNSYHPLDDRGFSLPYMNIKYTILFKYLRLVRFYIFKEQNTFNCSKDALK